MTNKTKEYYIIKKKLNKAWLGNLIGGIVLLCIGLLFMVLGMIEKSNLGGAIIVTLFIFSFLIGSFGCFITLDEIDKYKEKKTKIKIEEVKNKK